MATKKSCADRLVEHFKGQAEAADVMRDMAMKVNSRLKTLPKQTIHAWTKQGFIPEIYGIVVEKVTGGVITCQEVVEEAQRARRAKQPA